jgi:multiple sugar transport system substrate-binding protein
MKKKMVSLLLATTLVTGLMTGCGSSSSTSTTTDTTSASGTDAAATASEAASSDDESALPAMTTDEITLTYMHFDNEDLVNAVAEAFMEKYPNIHVETQAFSTDGYNDTLLNLVQSGQTPDCFMILGNCDFALSNALLGDMTEYWENDPENENILPSINSAKLGYYGTDKKLATPIKFFPDAIYCDLNVLETLNVEAPSTDWTWDEMIDAFKAATNTDAGTYGFNQYHSIITYYPVSNGDNLIGEFGWDGTSFHMDEWAKGVNQWAELVNAKYHAPYGDTDEMEAWTGDRTMWAAYTGKLGFQLDAWWTYLNLFDTPDYRDRGMEWVPYTTPASESGYTFGVLDFGGISSATEYPREAYELLKWMGWGVEGWKAKLAAYEDVDTYADNPLYRQAMPCPITTDEEIWEEFQQKFYPTAQTRTYDSVYDPVNGEDLVTAEEDEKYGKYFDDFFANCKNPIPFGDCQIPGFSSFLTTSYQAVGDTLGVEDQVRLEGKNANDFVAELEEKANEANRAALEAAKEAYEMIGIELNID